MKATTRIMPALVVALLAMACSSAPSAADGSGEGNDDQSEGALATKEVPNGTYTLESGPTGSMDSIFDSQAFPTRLTLKAGNKFDADVLVEIKETVNNPWMPWFPGEHIKKDTQLKHGTARFIKFGEHNRNAIDLDEVGIFYYTLSGKKLELATTMGETRTVTLERDDSWTPQATSVISLHCKSAHTSTSSYVDIKLDGEQNASGTAKVFKAAVIPSGMSWPDSGTYHIQEDDTFADGRRRYSGTNGSHYVEFSFKKSDLEGDGPMDVSAGHGEDGFTVYQWSLTCERR